MTKDEANQPQKLQQTKCHRSQQRNQQKNGNHLKGPKNKPKPTAPHNVISDLRIHIGGNGFYDAFIVSFTFLLIIIITTNYHA